MPGDFIEAGVFQGGFPVFLRALLAAHAVEGRKVFAADSYEGIPHGVQLGAGMDQMAMRAEEGSEVSAEEAISVDWTDRMAAGQDKVRLH